MSRGLNEYATYGTIGISWVLITGLYLFLGFRVGRWLDARWDTEPIFFVAGIVLGMILSLLTLVRELMALEGLGGRADKSLPAQERVRESNNFPHDGETARDRERGGRTSPSSGKPDDGKG